MKEHYKIIDIYIRGRNFSLTYSTAESEENLICSNRIIQLRNYSTVISSNVHLARLQFKERSGEMENENS